MDHLNNLIGSDADVGAFVKGKRSDEDVHSVLFNQPFKFRMLLVVNLLTPNTASNLWEKIANKLDISSDMYSKLLYLTIAITKNTDLTRVIVYHFGQQHGVITAYTHAFEFALYYDNDELRKEFQAWVDVKLDHFVRALMVANGRAACELYWEYYKTPISCIDHTDGGYLVGAITSFATKYKQWELDYVIQAMIHNVCVRYSRCVTFDGVDGGWHDTLQILGMLFPKNVYNYNVLEILLVRMNNGGLSLVLRMAPPNTWTLLTGSQLQHLASCAVCDPVAQSLLTLYIPQINIDRLCW
jgi:hypothetical protein